MSRCLTAAVALAVMLPGSLAQAQNDQVELIRQQIQALQEQLNTLEKQPVKRQNVTQIGSSRMRARAGEMVVRIYDLGDLFAIAPPYPAQRSSDLSKESPNVFPSVHNYSGAGGVGGGGFGGGGVFDVRRGSLPSPTQSQRVANQVTGSGGTVQTSQSELMSTIKKTINPDIWEENGGLATIAKLGNAFVISADEDTHDQIDALLNLFRQRWGTLRTVSVRAWWLWLKPAEIGPLLDSDGEEVAEANTVAFGLVPDDAWEELMARWRDEDEGLSGYQATVTCYNGQTVSTVTGEQSLAVTGIRPVLTKNDEGQASGRLGYKPLTSIVQDGAALQVTPVTNISGKTVLLDIHSRVTSALQQAEMLKELVERANPHELNPKELVNVLDRRRMKLQRLSTTLRVPVNRPMLVGGMNSSAPDNALNLYLFVRISVQELRNDQVEEIAPPQEAPPQAAPPVDPTNDEAPTKDEGSDAVDSDKSDDTSAAAVGSADTGS